MDPAPEKSLPGIDRLSSGAQLKLALLGGGYAVGMAAMGVHLGDPLVALLGSCLSVLVLGYLLRRLLHVRPPQSVPRAPGVPAPAEPPAVRHVDLTADRPVIVPDRPARPVSAQRPCPCCGLTVADVLNARSRPSATAGQR